MAQREGGLCVEHASVSMLAHLGQREAQQLFADVASARARVPKLVQEDYPPGTTELLVYKFRATAKNTNADNAHRRSRGATNVGRRQQVEREFGRIENGTTFGCVVG